MRDDFGVGNDVEAGEVAAKIDLLLSEVRLDKSAAKNILAVIFQSTLIGRESLGQSDGVALNRLERGGK